MLAYELSVYKNPKQVSRLMHSIYSSEDFYYINIFSVRSDKKRIEWMDYLKSFEKSNVSFMFSSSNVWARYEDVKVRVETMEHFRDFDYSYFINLSGQCYPIKSIRSIKETLSKNRCSYVSFDKLPEYNNYKKDKNNDWKQFIRRFEYYYYPIPNWGPIQFLKGFYFRRPELNTFIKIPRLNKKMLRSLDLYVGSAFFCLHKDHVEYILDFIKNNPDYIKFFSRVYACDEHFFHTILLNSPHKSQIVNDSRHYIKWPGPKILCTEDINDILNSGKFFARKFDMEIDSNVLDMLDLNNKSS